MARLAIIFIISTAMLEICNGQMVSTINGETFFNNNNLGTGHHEITTIVKDGESYYQVETTREGEPKMVTVLPAPRGSFVQISIGANPATFKNNYVFQSGPMSFVNLPDIPPVVIPEIRNPYVYIPKITIPGFSMGSFQYIN